MTIRINRLSARRVTSLGPGFHADGAGLCLACSTQVRERGCFVTPATERLARLVRGASTAGRWR